MCRVGGVIVRVMSWLLLMLLLLIAQHVALLMRHLVGRALVVQHINVFISLASALLDVEYCRYQC